jgi:uncharacterized membrane protein
MEAAMGRLLRSGVLLASALVLAGGILLLLRSPGHAASYTRFVPAAPDLRRGSTLLAALLRADPEAIIEAGVLVLIATPVARVVSAVIGFAAERDRLYPWVSLTVLAVLAASILFGR